MIEDLAKLISEARKQHTPSELGQRFVNRDMEEFFYLVGTGLDPFLKNVDPHEAVWVGYLAATNNPRLWEVLAT